MYPLLAGTQFTENRLLCFSHHDVVANYHAASLFRCDLVRVSSETRDLFIFANGLVTDIHVVIDVLRIKR